MAVITPITPTQITSAGVQQTLAAATACGDKFKPQANHDFIVVKNGSSAAITVTIPNQAGGDDLVVTVAKLADGADSNKTIAFDSAYPITDYIDSDGYVNIGYSLATTITVGVFRAN
jgi:hypothetical protein